MTEIEYGIIKVGKGDDNGRGWKINIPGELARGWPEEVTHFKVTADQHGIHLYPTLPPGGRPVDDRPAPFGEYRP